MSSAVAVVADLASAKPQLSEEQTQAVCSPAALTIISAGAGTGKTTTLLQRIVYLVNAGIRPDRMIVTTFTRQASRDMCSRLADDYPWAARVKMQTMHSLAARIFRFYSGNGRQKLIIDDGDAKDIFSKVISKYDLSLLPEAYNTPEKILRLFSQIKETHYIYQDSKTLQNNSLFFDMFFDYQKALDYHGALEISDIIPLAIKAMEAPEVAAKVSLIRHILVDEWQDTNPVQVEMIRRISSLGANVTVVGDDDQCIYSFRGAIPNILQDTQSLLPEVAARGFRHFALTENYRSTKPILSSAVAVINYNRRKTPKRLLSARSGEMVRAILNKTDEAEAVAIAETILEKVSAGDLLGDFAVLARQKSILSAIIEKFSQKNIPFTSNLSVPLYEKKEIKDIIAYIKMSYMPNSTTHFARVVGKPARGLGQAAAAAIIKIATEKRISIHEALSIFAAGKTDGKAKRGAMQLATHIETIQNAIYNNEDSLDVVNYITDSLGYETWAKTNHCGHDFSASLTSLRELCEENKEVIKMLDALMTASDTQNKNSHAVYVGTLHSAKGLEWDNVFIVGADTNLLPHAYAVMSGPAGMEEERRLIHVGMTRAKNKLVISCAKRRNKSKPPGFFNPSPFIREAGLRLVVVNSPIF